MNIYLQVSRLQMDFWLGCYYFNLISRGSFMLLRCLDFSSWIRRDARLITHSIFSFHKITTIGSIQRKISPIGENCFTEYPPISTETPSSTSYILRSCPRGGHQSETVNISALFSEKLHLQTVHIWWTQNLLVNRFQINSLVFVTKIKWSDIRVFPLRRIFRKI